MKSILNKSILFFLLLAVFSSCVMQKQYDDLTAEKVRLEAANTLYQDSMASLNTELNGIRVENDTHVKTNTTL